MKTLSFFDDIGWKEDPTYPHEEWQEAVDDGSTRQGYAAWVIACHERDDIPTQVDDGSVPEGEPEGAFVAGHEARFPVEQWLNEVAELDTRLGYGSWVAHQVEMSDED